MWSLLASTFFKSNSQTWIPTSLCWLLSSEKWLSVWYESQFLLEDLYFKEKVKKRSWVQRKNFLFQFPKTHKQSLVSIYMSSVCWVKKRLQMVFCVLYHLNTDYWNPWSFKKDLEIHFSFSKYYCMMTDMIQRWHCTATLPWCRKERGINGDRKNMSPLYPFPLLPHLPEGAGIPSCALLENISPLSCFCHPQPLPRCPGRVSTEQCFKQTPPTQLRSSFCLPSKLSFTFCHTVTSCIKSVFLVSAFNLSRHFCVSGFT